MKQIKIEKHHVFIYVFNLQLIEIVLFEVEILAFRKFFPLSLFVHFSRDPKAYRFGVKWIVSGTFLH